MRHHIQMMAVTCSAVCLLIALVCSGPDGALADCRLIDTSTPQVLSKRVSDDCTDAERDQLAISAEEVLAALERGQGIDLSRIVLTGVLRLDALPPVPLATLSHLPPAALTDLATKRISDVRVIGGPFIVRDAVVRGAIRTNVKDTYLVIEGMVNLAGTRFEDVVDLSRVVWGGPVDASDAVFQKDALFIQGLFTAPASFERTAFGPHTRFHRSRFLARSDFIRAGFNGLAEFLEVTFDQETSFSRSYFRLGTGFSGTHFKQALDFSEAVFDREAYFLFTKFGGDAYFTRATFRGVADFSDSRFEAEEDFSKVYFTNPPVFARAQRREGDMGKGLQNPTVLYVIAATLALFTVLLLLTLRKRQ